MTMISQAEADLLRSAKGGLFTPKASQALATAEALEDRGMLKVVGLGVSGVEWKLSGEGLKIAYGGEEA